MKNFKDLIVWQKATTLVEAIYHLTSSFPEDERFGLVSQMRRSAVSIPSNIAEGHMRTTAKGFRQFLAIARGSCAELETQVVIAAKLGFIQQEEAEKIEQDILEIAKMLGSLSAKLRSS